MSRYENTGIGYIRSRSRDGTEVHGRHAKKELLVSLWCLNLAGISDNCDMILRR